METLSYDYVAVELNPRIAGLLAQARKEPFHSGTKHGLYSKYRGLVLRHAKSPAERDEACRELRAIFCI